MENLINIIKDKEKMKHYILYILFGVLTTLIDFVSFYFLRRFVPIINENISNAIAIFLAIIFSYFTNREYVFKSQERNKVKEFSKFFLGRMTSTAFNIITFWLLTTFTTINELIIKAIISVVVLILNYVISKLFVFRKEDVK